MTGHIILLVVCAAYVVFGIPLSAVVGTVAAVVFTDDDKNGPIGALIGYVCGIVLWIVAVVVGILQIIALVNGS